MRTHRGVALWLFACAALVYAVLIVGGVTRLTHSGLSIVHWQPLVGVLPPLSEAAWEELFRQYRATPEFRLVNFELTLQGFKYIFWWEYAHRLLGRLIGLVFLLPLLWFAATRAISRRLGWWLAAIFLLGALQGALGWYMVASGLVDDPRVSPFRLTAHLGLALLIIGAILWTAWSLWPLARSAAAAVSAPASDAQPGRVPWPARIVVAAVFVMALTGGMVAGTRAGFVYNTFPLMGATLVPPDLMRLSPWYSNFAYNLATVQFVHRAIAWVLIVAVPAFWWWIRRAVPAQRARTQSNLMLAALALQITLGIATLLSVVALPLAAAHQAGAGFLYAATLWTAHALARQAAETQSASPHTEVGGAPTARSA